MGVIQEVGDVDELCTVLDRDPSVLVAFIPIKSTPELEEMAQRMLRKRSHIDQLRRASGEITIDGMVNDLEGTPFKHTGPSDSMEINLRQQFILTRPDDTQFNFATPRLRSLVDQENSLASLVLQSSYENAVGPDWHQDENALTINFYAMGKGVKYELSGLSNVTLGSPVVTGHRGKRHQLSSESDNFAGAVWHSRQSEEQERVNMMLGLG